MRHLRIAALLILAACATPEERCLQKAMPDTARIDTEIAETEASLARGYRLERRGLSEVGLSMCSGSSNVRLCVGGTQEVPPKPVPINRAEEERRLAALKAQRARMVADGEVAIAACNRAYAGT